MINEDREDYVKSREEFRFIKGVRPALKKIHQAGIPIAVITNQSAIGRKIISETELALIHLNMIRDIERSGGDIFKIYYCPHHPGDRCRCRKPHPGLLKKAAREMNIDLKRSMFIGDNLKDIQTGYRMGCRTVLVQTGQGKKSLSMLLTGEGEKWSPDFICESLVSAVPLILKFFQTRNPGE